MDGNDLLDLAGSFEDEVEQNYDDIDFGDLTTFLEREMESNITRSEYISPELASFFVVQPESFVPSQDGHLISTKDNESLKRLLNANRNYQQFLREQLVSLGEKQKIVSDSLRWLRTLEIQMGKKIRTRSVKRKPSSLSLLLPDQQDLGLLNTLFTNYTKAIQHLAKWTESEKLALAKGVRHQNQTIYLERILSTSRDDYVILGENREEIYNNAIRMVQGMTQKQLETNLEDLDWTKISGLFVPGRSAEDCRIQWTTNQHPLISHAPFNEEEIDQLMQLVAQYEPDGKWVEIAERLGTNRAAWQCLSCYRQKMIQIDQRSGGTGRKWTNEEDRIVFEAVQAYGDQNDWWIEAEEMLEGRTTSQILHRWSKALDPNKKTGRWTAEEDAWLLAAVRRYGHANWSFIREFVPKRTDVQCRERYMNVLDPALKHEHFTEEEDQILANAVESFGEGKWSQIAALLPNRTDNQCRRRWLVIKKSRRYQKKTLIVPKRQAAIKLLSRKK